MPETFLTLNDAVEVAVKEFGIDRVLAEQEFEQKSFVSNDQYDIGYQHGIQDSIRAITDMAEIQNDLEEGEQDV